MGHKNKREGLTLACKSLSYLQARQESNLQPPVLETGALPIELRTYERLDAQTHRHTDKQPGNCSPLCVCASPPVSCHLALQGG